MAEYQVLRWIKRGAWIVSWFGVFITEGVPVSQGIPRFKFSLPDQYLIVEILDDHLVHFELSPRVPGPGPTEPLEVTPMVERHQFQGPQKLMGSENIFETEKLRVEVDRASLCVSYETRPQKTLLTRICPLHLDKFWKGLTLSKEKTRDFYGLGQEFQRPGEPDGNWMNRVRHFGGLHGNKMVPFNGGDSGNTQIPILYALGEGNLAYGLFLDQIYQQQWDFTTDPAKVEMYGEVIRWYFIAGESISSIRHSFMDLVGRPLVPPKKAFGLWISEFGYRDWQHLESKLQTLRSQQFPLDGFVLDLFWFGGVTNNSDDTAMGRLTWDTTHFPDPEKKLAALREEHGLGIIPIEESYIGKNLEEHRALAAKGFLVKDSSGAPAYLTGSVWWGRGGMMDWTHPEAGDYWHRTKRLPLIQAGITGHWLDLGEPEMFHPASVYFGGKRQSDVHNIYNLKWLEGVYRGYQKYSPSQRPFLLSRSGAAGVQRFGTVMWSGDIGSDLSNLASHQNNQMHMSLSGLDYYGSDIGGFHRGALKGNLNEMYTQWFAYGMLFDVPARPHTENLCFCRETAPDRIGDLTANRENLRWRYRLVPYLYSLAHRAHLFGDPIFPPPLYHFPDDLNLRSLGRQKMIGPGLMAAVTSQYEQKTVDVYLPMGRWFDFYAGKTLNSRGAWRYHVDLYPEGYFRLPLFARAGAIVPLTYVDEKTMNVFGKRSDVSRHDELMVRIFSSDTESDFTLYEDDGVSTEYQRQAVRSTSLRQRSERTQSKIVIEGAHGNYSGALESRANVVEWVHTGKKVEGVSLLVGEKWGELMEFGSWGMWQAADSGWFRVSPTEIRIKTGSLPVKETKTFAVFHPRG